MVFDYQVGHSLPSQGALGYSICFCFACTEGLRMALFPSLLLSSLGDFFDLDNCLGLREGAVQL
jgi:hypothetical protein